MRLRRARWSGWAARLGILALAVNAVVPIHVAFRVSQVLAAGYCGHPRIAADDIERRLFALLSLQPPGSDAAGHHDSHRNTPCPVCSALVPLGAAALPVPPFAPTPSVTVVALRLPAGIAVGPSILFLAAYRSRAPPTV